MPPSDPAATPPRRVILIGRAPGNDIQVRSGSVSARHARVLVGEDGGLVLEDLGSRNGTFVGTPPRRVQREPIALRTPIVLGGEALPATALEDVLARTGPSGPAPGAIALEDASLVTFGRGASADVSLSRPLASSLHASIAVERGRVVVRDLGSTDGTFVDGRRIDRAVEISPGSIVEVADRRFRLAPDGRALEPLDGGDRDVLEADGVAVDAGGRRLLEGVSLVVQPGEMVAIMGPSGAGKSTLLSVLNGQTVPAAGRMIVGGLDLHDHFELFRGRIGFVPQDDILHADLTVHQALWYAARLRLPADTTDAEIETRIAAVIRQLGLAGTERTRVGDQRKRGVSGGQRKRVNLAMELLTDPPILVLDEPTSGLSSVDALSVIELLRTLADSGKTILVTIHQPSLEAFEKFDAVAVIARDESTRHTGRLAWFGRAFPDAIDFFEPRAADSPPPTSVDGLLRGLAKRPVAEWVSRWEQSVAKSIWVDGRATTRADALPPRGTRRVRPTAPFTQWLTLVRRTVAVKIADAWGTAVLFAQAPIVGLLIAAVFAKVVRSTPTPELWPKIGVNMATTLFVTALAAIWFGCSSTAREIVTEWPIYRRERMVGLSIPAYVLSKMTVLLGVAAIQSLLLLLIVVPACRMNTPWLDLFLVLYAAALAGGAIGLFVSATLQTAEAASGILPVLLLPMIVLGGILVPLADLPALTRPLAAAMPSRWAFEGLVVPEAATRPRLRVGGPEEDAPAAAATDDTELEPTPDAPPAAVEAPTAPEASLGRPSGPFRLAGQGGSGHQFILPGRRKIAEKLEEAAGQAKQEIEKAKTTIEEKAKKIQSDMKAESEKKMAEAKAEFERKSAESAERMKKEIEAKVAEARDAAKQESEAAAARMKEEMEKRVADAREQGRKESAEARAQVRAEIEEKVAATKADVQRQSDESAVKMREEVERKVAEAQEAAKKESDEAGKLARADVEKRVRDIEAEFEKKSREASASMEAKLHAFQERLDAEREKMNQSLETVRAATRRTLVPPAGAAGGGASGTGAAPGKTPASAAPEPTGQGAGSAPPPPGGIPTDGTPVDMAERFFGRDGWRSSRAMPLAVLLGMFAAGVAGTGLALRRREH